MTIIFFNASLPNDDPKNYYYEREWRKVNANLFFEKDDIDCILVPSEDYKAKLQQKFPLLKDLIEIL
jgi:hypothetical protein